MQSNQPMTVLLGSLYLTDAGCHAASQPQWVLRLLKKLSSHLALKPVKPTYEGLFRLTVKARLDAEQSGKSAGQRLQTLRTLPDR